MEVKNYTGIIIVAFVAIIVGLAMFSGSGGIAGTVGDVTTLASIANQTITAPAVGSSVELNGQGVSGTPVVTNQTGGETIPATNYTIAQGLGSDGIIALKYTSLAGPYAGRKVNVTYTYEPDGYISDSQPGARSITLLIVIFAALAIAAVGLWAAWNSGIRDYIGI